MSERRPVVLTLEDLMRMDGKAVLCVDAEGNREWALVDVDYEMCTSAHSHDWEFYCYGWMDAGKLNKEGWLAYKAGVVYR